MPAAAAPKALTKAQIIAQLAEKNELTKKQIAAVLESFAELAYKETKKNKKFTIPGIDNEPTGTAPAAPGDYPSKQ